MTCEPWPAQQPATAGGYLKRVFSSVTGAVGSNGENLSTMRQEVQALELLSRQIFMELDDLHVERVS